MLWQCQIKTTIKLCDILVLTAASMKFRIVFKLSIKLNQINFQLSITAKRSVI
jgi:hypothetical protein